MRTGLAALAALASLPALLAGSGCTQITKADDTKQLIEGLNEDSKKGRAAQVQALQKRFESAVPRFRMAVALPIIDYSTREAKAAEKGKPGASPSGKTPSTSPGGKGGGTTPPPAAEPKTGAQAPPAPIPTNKQAVLRFRKASTDQMVALCYRTPLYRELLFSPPPGSPSAPEEGVGAAPAESPQLGDTIEWLCPRCQRTVRENDPSCRDCGLAFAPEEMSRPRKEKPEEKPGEKPGEEPKAPDTKVPETKPVVEPVEARKPVETKWICSQCGNVVSEDQRFCDRCFVVLAYPPGVTPPAEEEKREEEEREDVGPGVEGQYKQAPARPNVMVYFPNLETLQGEIVETVQAYLDPNFKAEKRESQIIPIKYTSQNPDYDKKVQDLVAYCRSGDQSGDFFDFLLVPRVRQWELTYVGQSTGKFVAALALWVAIGEPANGVGFPTAWIASETFRADLLMDFDLFHVRSGQKVNLNQKDSFKGEIEFDVDQWDRGYYPWGIVLAPAAGGWFPRENAWPQINAGLSPHARNQIKKQLIEETLYKTLVKDVLVLPNPTAQEPQIVALLIANGDVNGRNDKLARPTRDLELMKKTLEQLGLHDGTKADRRGNRYVTFEKENATARMVRSWLKTQLPRLSPQDTLLIYYSGFGVTQYEKNPKWTVTAEADKWQKYLVLQDTDVGVLTEDQPTLNRYAALNLNDITEALGDANVANAFVVLDCSFGARSSDESIGLGRTLILEKNNQMKLPELLADKENFEFMRWVSAMGKRRFSRNCLVFAACDQDQAAMEYDSLGDNGAGLLTYFFCEALAPVGPKRVQPADTDDDGKVSTKELRAFVSSRVYKLANVAFGVPQEVRYGGEDMPYWFKPLRAGAASKKEEPKKEEAKPGAAPGAPAKPTGEKK